ncbi:MAG: DUF362 domain-containing protein [Nitrospirae bacterium]|nr:DUF362 domain-containing protein [Nitrospirota bacterium]
MGVWNRRAFLKGVGAGLLHQAFPMPGEEPEPQAKSHPEPFVPKRRSPLPSRVGVSGVSKPLGASSRPLREALAECIGLCDGLGHLRPGHRVLLKPAINSSKPYPATTSPDLVSELILLLKDRGIRSIVMADRSGVWRDTLKCMNATGLFEAASKSGADVIALEFSPWDPVILPEETHWLSPFKLPRILSEVDFVISLPTLRTHFLAGFTLALKNSVGLVDMLNRTHMHLPVGFQERLAEIALVVRPDLFILDGRKAFVDGGPDKGRLAEGGILVAGTDPVAVDVVGVELLQYLGAGKLTAGGSVWGLPQIARAVELKIGAEKWDHVKVESRHLAKPKEIMELFG